MKENIERVLAENGVTGKIIGHGDIAEVLKPVQDVTFFASGVSNSQETRESEYQREKDLLLEQDRSNKLVYFGSLAVFYSDTRYTKHKIEMEQLVKDNFPDYCIVRIGNISWGDNPHTLINTLKRHVANQEPLEIRDVYRYVVDQDEFLYWVGLIPKNMNCEMNVPGRRMKVKDILTEYVLKSTNDN